MHASPSKARRGLPRQKSRVECRGKGACAATNMRPPLHDFSQRGGCLPMRTHSSTRVMYGSLDVSRTENVLHACVRVRPKTSCMRARRTFRDCQEPSRRVTVGALHDGARTARTRSADGTSGRGSDTGPIAGPAKQVNLPVRWQAYTRHYTNCDCLFPYGCAALPTASLGIPGRACARTWRSCLLR